MDGIRSSGICYASRQGDVTAVNKIVLIWHRDTRVGRNRCHCFAKCDIIKLRGRGVSVLFIKNISDIVSIKIIINYFN